MEPINAKRKINFDGYKLNPKLVNLNFFWNYKSKFFII